MAEVREVEATVHVHANGPTLSPSRGVSIQSPGGHDDNVPRLIEESLG